MKVVVTDEEKKIWSKYSDQLGIEIGIDRGPSKLLLDSGAPSLYNKLSRVTRDDDTGGHRMGSTLEARKFDDFTYVNSPAFKEYVDKYLAFVKKHEDVLDIYVTIDIINNAEKTWELLKYIESCGLKPLPVWHFTTGKPFLTRIMDEYEYLAIGGMVPLKETVLVQGLDFVWDRYLTNRYGEPIRKVHGFAITATNLMFRYPWFCMTDNHTILTQRGWLGREEIKVGDMVLTYNDDGASEWKPVQKVHEFDVEDVTIRKYQGRSFSSETTLNHKWKVRKEKKINGVKQHVMEFKETQEFTAHDQIPRCAEHIGFPLEKKYSDELVKLIAWVFTDGCTSHPEKMQEKGYKYPSVTIYQCRTKHPEFVEEIRALLRVANSKWSESVKTEVSGGETVAFYISGDTKKEICHILGFPKKVPFDFILSLTKEQNHMFIEEVLKGDGWKDARLTGPATLVFPQKKGPSMEAFKLSCILDGLAISSHEPKDNIHNMETVNSSNVEWHTPGKEQYYEDVKHTGKIWCIEVENHTFFTRCRGSYYWTGNSVDSTSWIVYAMYGIILVPKVGMDGNWDYSKIPMKIAMSEKSSAQFESNSGNFYDYMSPSAKATVDRYIEELGGDRSRLISKHSDREMHNAKYYVKLEEFKRTSPFKKMLRRNYYFD